MYSPRIKIYDFGQLTGVNSGSVTSTIHPIVGELVKIAVSGDRTAAAGSLFLQTNDMRNYNLGSIINTNTTKEAYLRAFATDSTTAMFPVASEILALSGAGMGTGSLFNVKLYYK